jgi:hypothetical protein
MILYCIAENVFKIKFRMLMKKWMQELADRRTQAYKAMYDIIIPMVCI